MIDKRRTLRYEAHISYRVFVVSIWSISYLYKVW